MVIAREETPCRSGRVKLDRVSSAVPVGFATPGREHDTVSTAFADYREDLASWAENDSSYCAFDAAVPGFTGNPSYSA